MNERQSPSTGRVEEGRPARPLFSRSSPQGSAGRGWICAVPTVLTRASPTVLTRTRRNA